MIRSSRTPESCLIKSLKAALPKLEIPVFIKIKLITKYLYITGIYVRQHLKIKQRSSSSYT